MPTNTQTSISLHYDSSDTENPLFHHEMELDALAPILQGISGMLKEANKVINDADHHLGVRVRGGGFHEGSFQVLLQVLQSPDAIDILRAIGITVAGGTVSFAGVMSVIQKLKGKKIEAVRKVEVDGEEQYQLTVDGQTVNCPKSAKRLLTHASFRKHVDRVFSEPFRTTNADVMSFGIVDAAGTETTIRIPRSTGLDMTAPDEIYQKSIDDEKITTMVRFRSANAIEKDGWIVEIGGKEHKVEVLDPRFLAKIDSEDAAFNFGKSYQATVMRTTVTKAGTNRKSVEYKILTVHDQLASSVGTS